MLPSPDPPVADAAGLRHRRVGHVSGSRAAIWHGNGSGLALWGAGILLAFCAQLLFTPFGHLALGRLLYGIAALLALLGVRSIDRLAGAVEGPAIEDDVGARPTSRRSGAGAGIAFAVAGSVVGVPWLDGTGAHAGATLLWLFCLAGLFCGVAWWSGESIRPRWPILARARRAEAAALAAIVLVAVLLRFTSIEAIPPEVHGDEALFGLLARQILVGDRPDLFVPDDNHLGDGINALVLTLFGDNLQGLRTGSAIGGTASVVLLYLLVRRLFGVRPALIAAWLLAVAQWHVHYSRDGMTCMQALVATILLLYLVVRAVETRRLTDFVLVGFAAGLCLHVYYPARLAPILAGLYVAHRALRERTWLSANAPGLVAASFAAVVFLAPFGASWVAHVVSVSLSATEEFTPPAVHSADLANVRSRAGDVFVLTEANLQHERDALGVDRVDQVLALQAQHTLEAFNISGETSLQYRRIDAPLLDFWSSALLVLGALLVTVRIRQSRFFLVASWIWLTLLLGSVLTVDAPFSPRIVSVIPALMIPPALVVDAGWRGAAARWGRRGARIAAALVVLFLLLSLDANFRDYFRIHIRTEQPPEMYTLLARHIQQFSDRYHVVLVNDADTSLDYPTVKFLNPNVDAEAIGEGPIDLPVRNIPPSKGIDFIIQTDVPVYDLRFKEIVGTYRTANAEVISSERGDRVFASIRVDRSDLLAALGSR